MIELRNQISVTVWVTNTRLYDFQIDITITIDAEFAVLNVDSSCPNHVQLHLHTHWLSLEACWVDIYNKCYTNPIIM